jgi:sensor c-di-GMP phosphodiesterase-like protein
MWSLALLGPAAMIFIVAALGLTITVRSLRDDFRRQRSLDHDWRHGAMSRARRVVRACPQACGTAEHLRHEVLHSA